MSVLIDRVLARVLQEEVNEDLLVEQLGRIVRGESVKREYEFSKEGERLLTRETLTVSQADAFRGMIMYDRLSGGTLGLGQTDDKLRPADAIRLFMPVEDPQSIIWSDKKNATEKVEIRSSDPDASSEDEASD